MHPIVLFLLDQTDAEYADTFLTYRRDARQGNYTKLFNRADYSLDLPESVDWRTNNAVTGIKNQVCIANQKTDKMNLPF